MRDALTRLGGFAEPPRRADRARRARSLRLPQQARVLVRARAADGLVLGFHRAGRWDEVIDVEECLLTTDVGNAIREAVKRVGARGGARAVRPGHADRLPPAPRRPRGAEHRSGARAARHRAGGAFDADFLIETVTRVSRGALDPLGDQRPSGRGDEPPDPAPLGRGRGSRRSCSACASAFARTRSCRRTPRWRETLYTLARDAAGLTGDEIVYDLYCGTGTIGLALAARCARPSGASRSPRSRSRARSRTRRRTAIGNAEFFAGNVGQSLEELREQAGPPDVVVVDPPRAGLAGKALRRTGALQAPRLVYVSCNPTTLASDLAVLRDEYGYRLERCTPVDMFPHTPHIESVSLLTRLRRRCRQRMMATHTGGRRQRR